MEANTPLLVLAALALLLSAVSVLGGRRARRSGGARRRGRLGGGDVAAAAGALIALGVLATLALRRGGRPRAAPCAQLAGGDGLDVGERDITVTTVTRIRSSGAVATTTHRLDSIFVSIASYRDGECHRTIADLYRKAAFPERVFIGAVDQDLHANESCMVGGGPGRFTPQVRLARIPLMESRGPCYARYVGAQLYRGETYYLQLDSHMTMVPRWDEVLIAMAHQAGPRACLSTYPPDVTMMGQDPGVLTLCESYWNERGLLVFRASVPLPPRAAPRPIGFAAAGFMFCPATILADVPFDPELPMLFSGEEILFSARLWTAGYDVFAPGANVVFHLYSTSASTRPKFWEDQPEYFATMVRSEGKVKFMLGLQPDLPAGAVVQPRYGLGAERTLADFWRHVRVDPVNQTAASGAHFCPEHKGTW